MIYKITFKSDVIEFCIAKNWLDLLKSYNNEYFLLLDKIKNIEELSEEVAKSTMVANTDFDEDNPNNEPEQLSIWDLAVGDDFSIIASTEFD